MYEIGRLEKREFRLVIVNNLKPIIIYFDPIRISPHLEIDFLHELWGLGRWTGVKFKCLDFYLIV